MRVDWGWVKVAVYEDSRGWVLVWWAGNDSSFSARLLGKADLGGESLASLVSGKSA